MILFVANFLSTNNMLNVKYNGISHGKRVNEFSHNTQSWPTLAFVYCLSREELPSVRIEPGMPCDPL